MPELLIALGLWSAWRVRKYQTMAGATLWQADTWVTLPGGTPKRIVTRRIPTREMALDFIAKARVEAFEGSYFPERQTRARTPILTVAGAWELCEPTGKRDTDSHGTDRGRAVHLIRHLGEKVATSLSLADVEAYRSVRLTEQVGKDLEEVAEGSPRNDEGPAS